MVIELQRAKPAGMDRRAGPQRQFPGAGHEVGVDVRLEDRRDPDAVRAGPCQVLVDVPAGIVDRRLAGRLVGDQGEAGGEDAIDNHGGAPVREERSGPVSPSKRPASAFGPLACHCTHLGPGHAADRGHGMSSANGVR
jgi:hypothetical protein